MYAHKSNNHLKPRTWFAALLIFSFLLCIYTLSFNGNFRVDDEHILAARAQSLAIWGDFTEPQVFGNQRVQSLIPLGDQATQIEPAQTILGAGLYKLSTTLGLGGTQALFSLNIYVTAFTAVVVFFIVIFLGFSEKNAIACSILFGISSTAWPYATSYFRDPVAMFMGSLAFLGWLWVTGEDRQLRPRGLTLMVFGFIGGVLAKNSMVALLPSFIIASVVTLLFDHRSQINRFLVFIGVIAAICIVCILIATIPETGPLARFSLSYYRFLADYFKDSISIELVASILGPLISPAKSVFLFSPLLIFSIIGSTRIWRMNRPYTLAALIFMFLLAFGQALFYRERWAGSFGWGLRFMIPALPALFPLLASWTDLISKWNRKYLKLILWFLIVLSTIIQISGAVVNWREIYQEWASQGVDPYSVNSAWDIQFLAWPRQIFHLVNPQAWSIALVRLLKVGQFEAVIIALVAIALAVTICVLLRKYVDIDIRPRWMDSLIITIFVMSFFLPSIPLWWGSSMDPVWGKDRFEFHSALDFVNENSNDNDVVVLDSYATPLWFFWMNTWEGDQRWFSLPYEIPDPSIDLGASPILPARETQTLIETLAHKNDRLWYVTSDEAPDFGLEREVDWLQNKYELENRVVFSGEARVELYLFLLNEK